MNWTELAGIATAPHARFWVLHKVVVSGREIMVRVMGCEWNRFYADVEAWPDGAFHEGEEITIDGVPAEEMDLSAVPDAAKLTVAGGAVVLQDQEGPSLEAHFKRWRKRQTTTLLIFEVPHEAADSVRAAVAAAGGKVRA